MRIQRSTLMALALLAMVVAADGAASASKEGRPRKRRNSQQKDKCTASKSDPYYQVRMNITAPAPVLRGDYAQRALCPWTYRVDIDNRRFPSHIYHAVCAGHCGGYNLNWVEIRQQIMVLKKEQTGCTYTLQTMNVTVGCACVRAESVPAGSEGVNSMETRLSVSAAHSTAYLTTFFGQKESLSFFALCGTASLSLSDPFSQEPESSSENARERRSVKLSTRSPHSTRLDLSTIEASSEDATPADINSRSLTPWDNSMDKDVNRIPEVIIQANCLHSMCLDYEGKKDLRVNSIPIRRQIPVLRREKRGCHYVYKLEKQWVTFGCTCVRPHVSYVSF